MERGINDCTMRKSLEKFHVRKHSIDDASERERERGRWRELIDQVFAKIGNSFLIDAIIVQWNLLVYFYLLDGD